MLFRISRHGVMGAALFAALVFATVSRAEGAADKYKSWASHKVGTRVKWKTVTEEFGNHPGKGTSYEVDTLTEITPGRVLVTYKSIQEVDGKEKEGEALEAQYPAKPPSNFHASDLTGGGKSPKVETKESEETIKVGDKSYKCKLTDQTRTTSTGTDHKKTWNSVDVPGLLVKEESSSVTKIGKVDMRFEQTKELVELTEGS